MALRTCITNYSFNRSLRSGKMDVEAFLDFCGKAGFEGVDLMSYYWKDKDAEMSKVPEWTRRNGLKLVGYGTRSDFLSHDEAVIEESFENIRTAIKDAHRLGSRMCRVFGGTSLDGWTTGSALLQVAECMGQLVGLAEENDVVLTVENHGGFPATAEEVIACIEKVGSPFFASLLDTANFLAAGVNPLEEAKKLIPHVRHVHVKDMLKFPPGSEQGHKARRADYHVQSCVVGEGVVPNAEIFKALADAGYDGYVSLEAEGSPTEDDDARWVLAGLTNIRACIDAI